ncbi:MAG: Spy/CpxP family protein refolding chaperone [Nitrospirales bacterium]|nr:hypothetical protein [Nitrospira sp.]MDR4500331.1 Spy/CpxP family protein refolding chaperone [Nitrospirales bacterium]
MQYLTMKRAMLLSLIWPSCLTLILLAIPLLAGAEGYGSSYHKMGMGGHDSPHHKMNYSGHGGSHHGTMGGAHHGSGYEKGHGSSLNYGTHMGPHQSASEFIEHVLKFKDGMAITDEQAAKLRSVETEFKKEKIKMKAEVELANLDLHELLKNEESSLSDIEAKLKNVHNLEADLLMASIKAKREARAVLTDEQRSRMKAVHDRIKAYSSGGMSAKGHPGGYKHHGKDQKKGDY